MEPDILIPPDQAKDMLLISDDILSCRESLNDNLQAHYTLMHPRIISHQWHILAVKSLSASTPRLIGNLSTEVASSVESYFGVSNSWQDVDVLPVMSKIVSRLTNRFVVGSDVCKSGPLRCGS